LCHLSIILLWHDFLNSWLKGMRFIEQCGIKQLINEFFCSMKKQ
jgi:hypothetical protein